jgi:hypothetical protein
MLGHPDVRQGNPDVKYIMSYATVLLRTPREITRISSVAFPVLPRHSHNGQSREAIAMVAASYDDSRCAGRDVACVRQAAPVFVLVFLPLLTLTLPYYIIPYCRSAPTKSRD